MYAEQSQNFGRELILPTVEFLDSTVRHFIKLSTQLPTYPSLLSSTAFCIFVFQSELWISVLLLLKQCLFDFSFFYLPKNK